MGSDKPVHVFIFLPNLIFPSLRLALAIAGPAILQMKAKSNIKGLQNESSPIRKYMFDLVGEG